MYIFFNCANLKKSLSYKMFMVKAPDKSLTNTLFILIQFFLNSLSMFPDYFGFEGTQLFKGEIFHQHWLENLKIKKNKLSTVIFIYLDTYKTLFYFIKL